MAVIPVTPQSSLASGVTPAYTTPTTTDSYTVVNGERVILYVKKTGANACTVTITTPNVIDTDLAIADRTISVPATTGEKFIGPFLQSVYSSPISITFSEVTGLSFAVIALP